MVFDASSAALAVAVLLFIWLVPLPVFLLTTRLRGLEKFNWTLLVAVLSWPAFAIYLLYEGMRERSN